MHLFQVMHLFDASEGGETKRGIGKDEEKRGKEGKTKEIQRDTGMSEPNPS